MIETPLSAELLRGALDVEQTPDGLLPHRLPDWARAQNTDPQLGFAEAQPSGVRLVFRTAATAVEVDALPIKREYVGAPRRPDGRYVCFVDAERVAEAVAPSGRTHVIDMATGAVERKAGAPSTLRFDGLPARDKQVTIWLPHNEETALVALRSDAAVQPVAAPAARRWVHHGSSISHGSNALDPTETWPAVAARLAGVELTNLGFGGSALLDPFVARTIRDTPADLISVKFGINLVNTDLMRLRAFGPAVHGFLDTIRDGHPQTPLLVVGPVLCPIHEEVPGPTGFDFSGFAEGLLAFQADGDPADVAAGKLTLQVIRRELERIVAARSDDRLGYLDGLCLYGVPDAEALPLPDRLHPDPATHRLIGERFADLAFGAGGVLEVDASR